MSNGTLVIKWWIFVIEYIKQAAKHKTSIISIIPFFMSNTFPCAHLLIVEEDYNICHL
jgi:hypothetical protein